MCRHVKLLFVASAVPTIIDTPTDKDQCSYPVSFRSNRLLPRTFHPSIRKTLRSLLQPRVHKYSFFEAKCIRTSCDATGAPTMTARTATTLGNQTWYKANRSDKGAGLPDSCPGRQRTMDTKTSLE